MRVFVCVCVCVHRYSKRLVDYFSVVYLSNNKKHNKQPTNMLEQFISMSCEVKSIFFLLFRRSVIPHLRCLEQIIGCNFCILVLVLLRIASMYASLGIVAVIIMCGCCWSSILLAYLLQCVSTQIV